MKKGLAFLLALVLIFGLLSLPVSAEDKEETINICYSGIKIAVNGKEIIPADAEGNTVEPFLYNGTTYLPVRAIATALGLGVRWSDLSSTVYLSSGIAAAANYGKAPESNYSTNITVTYRNIKISMDGKTIKPKDVDGNIVEPFLYNGTTYLPVRAIAAALDIAVGWDAVTSTVLLGSGPIHPASNPASSGTPDTQPGPAPETVPGTQPDNVNPPSLAITNSAGNVRIDYSAADLGVVSVSSALENNPKTCVIITTPLGTQYKYFYTKTNGEPEDFVLSEGSGTYTASVYENLSGTSYSTLCSASFSADIQDELQPFLRPNFYVNYSSSDALAATAAHLLFGMRNEFEKTAAVYYYVLNNYTKNLEMSHSNYAPNLARLQEQKEGDILEMASMMTAMLRSGNVAARLVSDGSGDGETRIDVYDTNAGWIKAAVRYDGHGWKLSNHSRSVGGNDQEFMY